MAACESENTAVLESPFLDLLHLMESTGRLFDRAQNLSKEGSFMGLLLWDVLVCMHLGLCCVFEGGKVQR